MRLLTIKWLLLFHLIRFAICILPYYFNCIVKKDIVKTKILPAQTKHKQTILFGVNLAYVGGGGWVTSEWPINIILISKKPKQHKQIFLQHKPAQTKHKRLRLFWRRFALGGGQLPGWFLNEGQFKAGFC